MGDIAVTTPVILFNLMLNTPTSITSPLKGKAIRSVVLLTPCLQDTNHNATMVLNTEPSHMGEQSRVECNQRRSQGKESEYNGM